MDNQANMFGATFRRTRTSQTVKNHQRRDLAKGKASEQKFCRLTGAKQGTHKQDVEEHTDVIWNGITVDVKAYKESHRSGYVLVEIRNGQGEHGWCSHKGASKIAFEFETKYVIVNTMDLRRFVNDKVKHSEVLRRNNIPYSYTYRLLGRTGRKDVFLYITKDDLLSLPHETVSTIE